MTTVLAPIARPLAARLREETREVHESAERSAFMAKLAAGDLTRSDLRNLTAQLIVVYSALEDAARTRAEDDAAFAPFHDPALERFNALHVDLQELTDSGRQPAPVLPEAQAYSARIRAIAHDTPALIAHHYTRYLGDLSGGQALASIVGRALAIRPGEPGISFYHFARIPKVKPYKDRYRAALDAAELTDAERDRVVSEAVVAFQLNQALFLGLDELGTSA